jgi:arylsulfatase A-like enzyme
MKSFYFSLVWFAMVVLGGAVQAAEASAKPNIIFILADDIGIDGIGCYGSDRFKDKTPHLDALARSGLRFERCYSTPLCGPTRCVIMTGRYGFRTGGLTNQTAGNARFQNEPSLAKVLKQAGYATGMAGKWRQMSDSPGDWGFDEYVTDPTASGYFWVKGYTKNGEEIQKDDEFYYPDVQRDFAIDFIERHRDEPFFFYYSMHLVHGPILRTPDSKPETAALKEAPPKAAQPKGPLYDDNVAYMDKQVGQLVAELDRLGLRERTLVVFSADNGTAGVSGTIGGRQVNGAKGSMQEGGSRVALIANWKGVTPAGSVLSDLTDHSDLLPTFAELAGAKAPQDATFDGTSFAPQLRGEKGSPREWIFVQLGARWYARNGGWKLNESGELFDMKHAPFVEQSIPADGKDPAAQAARERLQAVLAELNPAAGKTLPAGAETPKKAKKKKKKAAAP